MLEIVDLKKTAERLSHLVDQLVRHYDNKPDGKEKEKTAPPRLSSPGKSPQPCFPSWLP